jgi:alkylation response protein AidB-like acyl-CoA dehydrogenase
VNLSATADQQALQDSVRAVFTRESTSERVRAVEAKGFDPKLWRILAELGAVGIAVDEPSGGVGAGLLELVLIAQEAGRRAACVPLVEAAVGARLLARYPVAGADDLLARVLHGSMLVVFAPRRARDGIAALVAAGAVADGVIALDGEELVVALGASAEGVATLGFTAVADRSLAGSGVVRHVLASGPAALAAWDVARAHWRLATAGVLAGLAAEAVGIGARYALQRCQFGVQIGSFQVLQQALADSAIAAEGTELLARESAWRADHDVDGWPRMAAMAFVHAAETAVQACERALHVHGGYGYTLEYDIQLYLRKAKALSLSDGDPELAWEEIGAVTVGSQG